MLLKLKKVRRLNFVQFKTNAKEGEVSDRDCFGRSMLITLRHFLLVLRNSAPARNKIFQKKRAKVFQPNDVFVIADKNFIKSETVLLCPPSLLPIQSNL